MKLLEHESLESRIKLINHTETISQLKVDPSTLTKFSSTEVLAHCVVCSNLFKRQMKSITTGKGLTCSQECSRKFKLFKQAKGKAELTEEEKTAHETKRKAGLDKLHKDPERTKKRLERMAQTMLERYGVKNPLQDPEIKKRMIESVNSTLEERGEEILAKRKQTNLEKYGFENPSQDPNIQEEIRKINLEKYGVEYFTQHSLFKERGKETLLENYGVDNPAHALELLEKRKQTMLEKYGAEYPSQVPEIRERIYKTCEEKYGARIFITTEEFKKKKNETLLANYGVTNPGLIEGHSEQIKKTMLERYGVESFKQLESEKNKLKEWCIANPGKLHTSKPEQEILDWVREFYPSARKHKEDGQEIDIFIPELNIGLEYNGLYWHSEEGIKNRNYQDDPKNYHLKKTLFYKEKGVRIIHIWEHLWRDRKEQVKSFLRSALKLNQYRLAARKCTIIWSNNKKEIEASNQLLDLTHIQGEGHATRWVANVYHEDRLVATASFAKHHRNNKDWVLTRFTTKANYTIQGILGKISKLASQKLEEKIVSWADLALSEGNGYLKAGWRFEEKLPADYFYYNPKNGHVFSKQSRQKNLVNTPEGMTEREHACLDGLTRVWDCGKVRFGY